MNSETDWDVIVVGAGGSGLAAAVSAAEHGARVLVLERCSEPGGTTGIAVGSFTASCTDMQRNAGLNDRFEDHAADAGKFAPAEIESRNNEPLRQFFVTQAAETLTWLKRMGLSFVGPYPEPPNRIERMHNVVPGAKAYVATLELELLKRGGRVACDHHVSELRVDDCGRVTGVCVEHAGEERTIAARQGVILAGGDYANCSDTIARYKGHEFAKIGGINDRAVGGGHRLAESVNAKLVNMDVTYGPELRFVPSASRPFQQWLPRVGWLARLQGIAAQWLPRFVVHGMMKRLLVTWQHPESQLFYDGAVLLNHSGLRFTDETSWPGREKDVAEQAKGEAFILVDERLAAKYSAWPNFVSTAPDIAYAYMQDYERLRPDVTARLTAAKLYERFGDGVRQELERFNSVVDGGGSDPFGREKGLHKIDVDGEFYLLGPLKAYFTTTEGGALVNESLQAIDVNGEVIPGLYAVGQNGLGGMILWGHGLHIAWALTSGRLAGIAITVQDR